VTRGLGIAVAASLLAHFMQLSRSINYTSVSLPLPSGFGVFFESSLRCFLKSLKRKQDENSEHFVELQMKIKCCISVSF